MIAQEPTVPSGPASADTDSKEIGARHGGGGPPNQALSRLRGAGVDVDVGRAGRVVVGACLVALAGLVVGLYVAGAHKNAQISGLRQHGVAVQVKVTGCLGLLGGSGSNVAGYACTGMFALDGHRYSEDLPGTDLRAPGTVVKAVAVPGDPPLLSTARDVATQRASASVYLVPTVLFVVEAVLVGAVVIRRRRVRAASLAADGSR